MSAAILAAAPLLLLIYFTARYGDMLAFVHARQAGWQRATGFGAFATDFVFFMEGPLLGCPQGRTCLTAWDLTRRLLGCWYLTLIPASALLTLYARRTLGAGLTVWVWLSVVLALPNGLDGMGRFTAVCSPCSLPPRCS